MDWITGVLKDTNGNWFSAKSYASDVYMSDGTTLPTALRHLDEQEAALLSSLSNLTSAIANLQNALEES